MPAVAQDPLKFRDSKRYADRLRDALHVLAVLAATLVFATVALATLVLGWPKPLIYALFFMNRPPETALGTPEDVRPEGLERVEERRESPCAEKVANVS